MDFRPEDSKNIFREIFEGSPVGLAVVGRTGSILYTNPKLRELFGTDNGELTEHSFDRFFIKEDAEEFRQRLSALLKTEETLLTMEARYKSGSEGFGWLRINASVVEFPSLHGRFVVTLLEDVSHQKEAEERLTLAKEEAERAARIKSDFLANMSHEIRTPIHTITGMTELLQETRLDAEQSEYAHQVEFSADILLSLINDILDFSKIEAGRLSLEAIDFDIYRTVEDSVDLVALEAHKKGLEVLLHIHPKIPRYLVGDPIRVRQIIVNLFNNAMKFTQEGEIVIDIDLVERGENIAEIYFSVRDTGIGIPEDKLTRLFTVFTQVDSSTTRKYGGSGLGLSICKNLVEMMGGTIGVESEEGGGSVFWFRLPCPIAERDKERWVSNNPFPEYRRAIVVDDNKTSRGILSSYLSNWGFEVDEAPLGEEALEMIRAKVDSEQAYEVCLIDLLMPRMDGWHLASEINSDANIKNLKLFLMSPAGKSGDEAKMKLLNWFDGYLSKPIKLDELTEVFNRTLGSAIELEPVEELTRDEVKPLAFNPVKVLVAEDHEVNQQLFRTILENLGLVIILASNGKEAVEAADESIRLVFMDVQMPEMNGYEATRAIREKGLDMPIIAVTASAIKGEREKALESGMTDFLTKPFKKRDVLPVLQKWVTAEAVLEEAEDAEPSTTDDEIFNLEEAVDTFMGNREVVLNLVKTLFEKVEGQMPGVREALENSDFELLREEAHSIKGSSLNLSVVRLGEAAARLESAAREEDEENAKLTLQEMESAFLEFGEMCSRQALF